MQVHALPVMKDTDMTEHGDGYMIKKLILIEHSFTHTHPPIVVQSVQTPSLPG